jgi:hypothetical protein
MAFELIDSKKRKKNNQFYTVKLYFDFDTNTQKHEYCLNENILYSLEYESYEFEDVKKDINIDSIVQGFDFWYDQVGPDWQPEAF